MPLPLAIGSPSNRKWKMSNLTDVPSYSLTILLVLIASALTYVITPLHSSPTVLFFAVIVAASRMGKVGPVFVAILGSCLIVDFCFVSPVFSILQSTGDLVRLGAFAMVGLLMYQADRVLRQKESQLRQANELLEMRVTERTSELSTINASLVSEISARQETERTLREKEYEIKNALERVTRSVEEKELLLRELQHRVKNNLQVIMSLLSLQKSRINDPACQLQFKECQQRVRTIAQMHQQLCSSPSMSHINLARYFKQLIQDLFNAQSVDRNLIQLSLDIDEIPLSSEKLIPCALIVNELVCNSLKYAFPDGRNGEVCVKLHQLDGHVVLEVSDNGIGKTLNPPSAEVGIGTQIIESLVRQLGGELLLSFEGGASANVLFT